MNATTRARGKHRAARRPMLAAPSAAAGRRAAVMATAGGLLVSTIGGATAAHAAPVDHDAAKKLSTVDLGALTDQARTALESAPVVTVDAEATMTVEKVTPKIAKAAEIKAAPEPVREVAPSRSAERTAIDSSTSTESTSEAPAAPAADSSRGAQVASIAARYIGVKYVVGGASPSGFDCSGLVTYAYAQVGVTSLPRSSSEMYGSSATTVVSAAEAQPGDLIWSPGHISIYIGNGQQIEATRPGGWVVRQSAIWQSSPTFLRVTG
ncbi:cell wall-associated NlpC family hydrolase [Isoptericola sp. CG 20/1183]|uniref:Cell wall-associated NlpC family hydrolase n=1 Tax=Isoptericola halotolerans TaxID=300560 RepID=A0ABX5EGI1_9MICO|nr:MULTISPECIES: C40 family peptidase [Isoptericola]PRZ06331.1 cell wall-associated NlpC family hydrolase [Isoptericola halotolerans]PRZ06863.1 cell wall-associated NlpC family hydrolase [Isoptericola sp. CG 20/1183]